MGVCGFWAQIYHGETGEKTGETIFSSQLHSGASQHRAALFNVGLVVTEMK